MHPASECRPADDRLILLADLGPLIFPESSRERIEEIWFAERAARGYQLFDAPIMYYGGREGDVIHGGFLRYKELVAYKREPSVLGGPLVTMGVSGLTICEGKIVLSRRAAHLAGYAGMYEAVPSGGVDDAHLGDDNRIDYRAQLIEEMKEEAGVAASHVVGVSVFALALDKNDRALDVCMELKTDLTTEEFRKIYAASGQHEYDGIEFISPDEMTDFASRNRERIIPTTLAMLETKGYLPPGF